MVARSVSVGRLLAVPQQAQGDGAAHAPHHRLAAQGAVVERREYASGGASPLSSARTPPGTRLPEV